MSFVEYFSKFIFVFFVSYFIFEVRSITFEEEVFGDKSRSINEDVIVPMEYLPYPESEPFYSDVVPEIQRAANRSKRAISITYPFGPPQASLVMDFYFNIEVANPGHVYAPLTLQMRNFLRFPNLTLFEKNRSFQDRMTFFQAAENMLESIGISGKLCLLRAICERSEYHVITDGLFGEVISLLLRVDSSYIGVDSLSYNEAFEHGRHFGDCGSKYSECPFSFFSRVKG
ncbi:UNVERIFIED_CONTAM: hypothetical protein RMT77_003453 [Armadillidium vulgare]